MRISDYDISDIGSVKFTLNYDEDDYNEYLEDNGLTDCSESQIEFVKDNCSYDVEFTDSDYFHHLGYDTMYYDEIESMFGERLAEDVLKDCMDFQEHEFEPQSYANEQINLEDPNELSNLAMKYLKHGEYFKNARGFILPNGVIVFTETEHNQCSKVPGVNGTFHFIELGCIRILDHAIDIAKKPTDAQYKVLYRILKYYYTEELYLDLMNKQIGNFSKKYDSCEPDDVISDIERYFKGIIPRNKMFESKSGKVMKLYHWSTNVVTEPRIKGNCGYGFYMAKNKKYSRLFGNILHKVTVKPENTLNFYDKDVKKNAFFNIDKQNYEKYISGGYDSLAWYRNGELCEFIALKPEIIKDIEVVGYMNEEKIGITFKDIRKMVNEIINHVFNVITEEEMPPGELVNDEAVKEYEAIGFANKFYTLWTVFETKYKKTYIYRKNISFSKEKAHKLYPDAEFVEDLRGKTHSFTVSIGGGEGSEYMERFSIPVNRVENGAPVSVKKFIVLGIKQGKTRYGSMYQSIIGDDAEGMDRYIINVFDKRNDMPKQGDILSVQGKVGFYNENSDSIYLNDATWDFVSERHENTEAEIPDGAKFKNVKMVVTQHTRGLHYSDGAFKKAGFIVLMDVDGNMFYIDSYVQDYRTGEGVQKFRDIIDKINKGTMLNVSGTVQIKDGYNRIIRAKLELCDEPEESGMGGLFDDEPQNELNKEKEYRNLVKIYEVRTQGKSTRQRNANRQSKIYNTTLDKVDDFIRYISEIVNKHNGKLYINGYYTEQTDYDTIKQKAEPRPHGDYDSIDFTIEFKETDETISYVVRLYCDE